MAISGAITGGCLCGRVRFSIEAEPMVARTCWCRDCQYWGAGSATVNAVFPKDAMTVTGETADYVSKAATGNVMHRRFCPQCGTQLFSEAEVRPQAIVVRIGALDHPDAIAPQVTIWTASAPRWACIDADLPAFEGQG